MRRPAIVPLVVGALAAGALALRVLGAFDPLWLDEIWSLERAAATSSWRGVFTALHGDNNHWLVSLWLRALGEDAAAWALRLPSIVLGALSVPAAFLAGRARAGAGAGVVAAALVATSYPFVHYGSEARGYAPAVLFLLVSAWLLERGATRPRAADAVLLAATSTAGLLCHLTFGFGFAALAVGRLVRGGPGRARSLLPLLAPVAALAVLYFVDLRHWTVAGGTDLPAWRGIVDAAAWTLGAPPGGPAAFVAAALLLLAAARSSRAAGDVTALLLPLLAATLAGAAFVPPRYFLVPMVLPVLALAELAAAAWRRRGAGRIAVALGAAFFVLHQTFFLREFLEHGRGPTPAVIEAMLRTTRAPDGAATVAFDFPPRGAPVVRFHARRVEGGERLSIVREDRGGPPPEFLLHHVFAGGPEVGDRLTGPSGHAYVLERRDERFGLSGWTWLLYRLAE